MILSYPGALIRRVVFRKKTIKEYQDEGYSVNAGAFLLTSLIVVLIFKLVKFLPS